MKTLTTVLTASLLSISISGAFAAGQPMTADRQVQSFLNKLNGSGGKPMEQLSPKEARQVLTDTQANATLPPAEITQKNISADGQAISLTIVKPQGATGTLPVFMFFHGGGWILGDFPTHERLVRDLVVASGAAAVFVNYTPSPEAHYPVAINQAYAATRWVAEHGNEIGVDGSRLAVAGNSVGGNMATVVALMAKEKGAPKIRFEALLWPVTNADFDTGSYKAYAKDHFLTRNMMKWFWDAYTKDAKQRKDIHASPLLATQEQLTGLPPTLIQTAELDVLRDEGEDYGRKLDAAGVDVTVTRYNGMIHDFGLLNPLSQVPAVRSQVLQAGTELKQHLQ